jgi:hypothetical protein
MLRYYSLGVEQRQLLRQAVTDCGCTSYNGVEVAGIEPSRAVVISVVGANSCPWRCRDPSLRLFHAVPSLPGVRKGVQTFQRTSILSCLSVEGHLRMRKPPSKSSQLPALTAERSNCPQMDTGRVAASVTRQGMSWSVYPPSSRRRWLYLRTHTRRRRFPWSPAGRW